MKIRLIFAFAWMAAAAHAELHLNGLFTDNMVLQRNRPVPVWGTADPGAKVTVKFADQKKVVVAGADGRWQVMLDSMKAELEPQKLMVESPSATQQLTCSNVLVGDVWLCAGQSNMARTMRRFLIWDQVKDGFENDQLRFFKIKEGGVGSPQPTKELVVDKAFQDSWQSCTPEFAAEFSAAAGFFGMKLQRDTGVPIGLLYANRGGTRANMWMPRKVMDANPLYERFLAKSNIEWTPSRNNPGAIQAPAYLYNGSIHPLVPFAIRGVIWYQGESDAQYSDTYTEMMADLVQAWRTEWGIEFPFLFVQLAPYDRVSWDRLGEGWAWLREAQVDCLDTITNSGMAVIIDGGEANDIHPQAKDLPGERLAVLAAALDDPSVQADFPRYEQMTVQDSRVRIEFGGDFQGLETRRVEMNTEPGFLPGAGPNAVVAEADSLEGFTICGADHTFFSAEAKIVSGDTVEVWSPQVPAPVAVRYGWTNFPLCNLYGGNGMPASPFRTDDFSKPNLTGERVGSLYEEAKADWGSRMELHLVEDGTFQTVDIENVGAQKADGLYLYFSDPERSSPAGVAVHVVYFDEGFSTIQLRYDSTDTEIFAGNVPGPWKPAGEVTCQNSKRWKVVSFDLPDANFGKRCNGGDLRLQSDGPLTVAGVFVQAARPAELNSGRDVAYGPSPSQQLDVWWDTQNTNAPIVFLVHGGGWRSGDKRAYSNEEFARWVTGMGCVLVSPNYRLLDSSENPTAFELIQDVWTALAWVREHADEFGADKDRIVVGGASAGSHLAACLAYGKRSSWLEGTPFAGQEAEIQSSIKGYYGDSCVLSFDADEKNPVGTAMREQCNPIDDIAQGGPPAYCVNGDADFATPLERVLAFQKKAESVGVDCTVEVIPEGRHMTGSRVLMQSDGSANSKLPEWLKDPAVYAELHKKLGDQFEMFLKKSVDP